MTCDTSQTTRAQRLAEQLHVGQNDKVGIPYIEHCRRVAAKLNNGTAQTVAWLHDVLEDTMMVEAELRGQFDAAVVDAVVALTRTASEDPAVYYRRVRANTLARQVKLADIHDNLDPLRIAKLDNTTRNRLVLKYGKALQMLFGDSREV